MDHRILFPLMMAVIGLSNLRHMHLAATTGLFLGEGSLVRRTSSPERFAYLVRYNTTLSLILVVSAAILPFTPLWSHI